MDAGGISKTPAMLIQRKGSQGLSGEFLNLKNKSLVFCSAVRISTGELFMVDKTSPVKYSNKDFFF